MRARRCTCRNREAPSLSADVSHPSARGNGVGLWTYVGLACVFFGPFLLVSPVAQVVYAQAGAGAAALGQAALALLAVLVVVVLRFGERLPLRTIGLVRPRAKSLAGGIAIGFGVYVALALIALALAGLGAFDNKAATASVLAWSLPLRIVVAAAAGIIEEVLYRGYAIERLTALTGRHRLSAALALAAFALAHVPFWGWAAVATPLLGGAFFTLLYIWRRDLVLCITAHSTIDLIGLVLLPALAGIA